MKPRYDEALPILVKYAIEFGIDFQSGNSIVVRDSSGRLAIALKERSKTKELSAKLTEILGPYAMTEPVLPSVLFDTIKETGTRDIALKIDDIFYPVRLADRRVVGMDWLCDFSPVASGPPRLVFGSLKGGVGRTTAIAILAADLAFYGYKVLCIDLDLEAPGLGTMLLQEDPEDRRPQYGAIDYLIENGLSHVEDDELFDHIGISHFGGSRFSGTIHVLPAVGRITDENPANMIGKLSRSLTENISVEGRSTLIKQIREMVDRFAAREAYDAVLVDARAGLAESTASTWLGLGAAKLLLFGSDQKQTFRGYKYVLSHLSQTLGAQMTDSGDDWRTYFTFIQSKAPSAHAKRISFREKLHELCCEELYDADEGAGSDMNFNFSFHETGLHVPHDAAYILYHQLYEMFNPIQNDGTLECEVYNGPFSAFLDKAWKILRLTRNL